MTYLITLDVGTSSTRAFIYDTGGNVHFTSTYTYTSIYTPPSQVEQDPADWRKAAIFTLKEAARYAQSKGLAITAIAVTSQRASVIPVDARGNPLHNALMWQDKRTTQLCQEFTEKISPAEIYKRTGLRANPYFSLPKMLWFKVKTPDVYRKTAKFLGVQDYVVYLLTGKFITDWSQAARTMLMNIKTFEWDREILDVSGLDRRLLCELSPPGTIAGTLTADFSRLVGLKEGTPVIISGGDQQNAAIALNVLKPGIAETNTGTGSFVIAYSDRPVFDEENRVLCSASAIPGKWIIEAGIFNTGSIYRWFRDQFFNGQHTSYQVLNEEAAQSPVGANGVLLLPHFEGSAAPFWNPYAKGLFFNLSLGTKRGDLIRAILEGIALEIAENISLIEKIAGKIDLVSVAGGMTRSDLFNTIQANAFGKTVISYPNSEATSIGATISAAVSLGVYNSYEEAFSRMVKDGPKKYEPNPEDREKYEQIKARRHRLYNALAQGGVYEEFMKTLA